MERPVTDRVRTRIGVARAALPVAALGVAACLALTSPAARAQDAAAATDGGSPLEVTKSQIVSSEVIASVVRDEVQGLQDEIRTLKTTVGELQQEVSALRAALREQRKAQEESGYFRQAWKKIKQLFGQ